MTFGFLLFFTAVTIAAFVQGQGWLSGQPEVNILPSLRLWNIARAVAGGMIYAAGLIQAYNIVRTYLTDTHAKWRRRSREDALSSMSEAPANVSA